MILQINRLAFSYNSHPVLRDITFSLKRGQIMAVVGVNGAGKSTLLKCINRILKPQTGSVLIDDMNAEGISQRALARRVSYTPQRPHMENLTVFDAVLLGRRPHINGRSTLHDHQVTRKTIEIMNLQQLALRPMRELSGGEVQKVVIARALSQQPEVLLLDEPTSHLDMKNAIEVISLLKRIAFNQKISILAAMHDLNMALRFADAFLLIRDGVIHNVLNKADLTEESLRDTFDVPVRIGWLHDQPVIVPICN